MKLEASPKRIRPIKPNSKAIQLLKYVWQNQYNIVKLKNKIKLKKKKLADKDFQVINKILFNEVKENRLIIHEKEGNVSRYTEQQNKTKQKFQKCNIAFKKKKKTLNGDDRVKLQLMLARSIEIMHIKNIENQFSSVHFSRSVMSDSATP